MQLLFVIMFSLLAFVSENWFIVSENDPYPAEWPTWIKLPTVNKSPYCYHDFPPQFPCTWNMKCSQTRHKPDTFSYSSTLTLALFLPALKCARTISVPIQSSSDCSWSISRRRRTSAARFSARSFFSFRARLFSCFSICSTWSQQLCY